MTSAKTCSHFETHPSVSVCSHGRKLQGLIWELRHVLCAAVLSTMVLSHPVDMVIGKYSVRLHLALGPLGNHARFLFGRSGQVWPRISNSDTLRRILQVCVVGGAGGIGQPLSMLMAMDPNVPISIIQRAKYCSKLDSTAEIPRFPSFACMLQPQTSGDVGHVVCFFLQRCFSLQDRQDLTLAMVPAEGVAADLSHLNMKCKVSWMGKYGNRAPETSGFKIFKCFALKTMRIRDNKYFGTFRKL